MIDIYSLSKDSLQPNAVNEIALADFLKEIFRNEVCDRVLTRDNDIHLLKEKTLKDVLRLFMTKTSQLRMNATLLKEGEGGKIENASWVVRVILLDPKVPYGPCSVRITHMWDSDPRYCYTQILLQLLGSKITRGNNVVGP